jgi:hypothetical protein
MVTAVLKTDMEELEVREVDLCLPLRDNPGRLQ